MTCLPGYHRNSLSSWAESSRCQSLPVATSCTCYCFDGSGFFDVHRSGRRLSVAFGRRADTLVARIRRTLQSTSMLNISNEIRQCYACPALDRVELW